MDQALVCRLDGCERPVKTKGYCDVHYRRVLKHGDPGEAAIRPKVRQYLNQVCIVDLCERYASKSLLCTGHYQRLQKTGRLGSDPIRVARERDVNRTQKDRSLWSHYRMTLEQYEQILEGQNHTCPICSEVEPRKWHVDHDHSCCSGRNSCGGCIRGIICERCNIHIGYIEKYLQNRESFDNYLGLPCA